MTQRNATQRNATQRNATQRNATQRNALVLDDDPLVCALLSEILTEKEFKVQAFASPHQFLATHQECKQADIPCYDVIISDNRMPGMSGLDFVHLLKEELLCPLPTAQIALISGWWQPQDLQKAKQLGCQIFHKPTSFDDLFAWLDGLC